jgi:hypothetical protein
MINDENMKVASSSVTKLKSIYAIQQEYVNLVEELEENGGELTEELEALLIQNEEDFKAKVKNYVFIIKEKESSLTLLDDEIRRLQALKKARKTVVDKLETTILNALLLFGKIDKKTGVVRYEGDTFNLVTRKSNKTIVYDSEGLEAALIDKAFEVTTDEEFDEFCYKLDHGILDVAYKVPFDEQGIANVEFETPAPAGSLFDNQGDIAHTEEEAKKPVDLSLNETEVDFLNSHLIYDAQLAITYADFVAVVKALKAKGYSNSDIGVKIKIPTADVTAVLKTSKGFRIAAIQENKSLKIS